MKRRGGVGTWLSMRTVSAVAVLLAGLAVAGAPPGPSAAALAAPGADTTLPSNSAVEHSVGLVAR